MSRFSLLLRMAVFGAAASIAFAACSSDVGAAAPSATAASPAYPSVALPSVAASAAPSAVTSADPSAGASAADGETYTLEVATDAKLGKFLTGEDGKALYTFKPDSTDKSTCNGGCATVWPPLLVTAADTVKGGTGVTGKINTFKRDDGSIQVSYNGKPLYYFVSDTKAGEVTGQGVENFFVATP
jgi:predicted lipoprotein with Yx(FWY)xxD motif